MDDVNTTRLMQATVAPGATPEEQLAAARHLLEQNRAAEALPHLERVSAVLPSAEVAALAGCVAVSLGDLDRAEAQFKLQAERAPNEADAHVNLGLLNAARDRWEAAAYHFRAAVAHDPTCADWQNDLGVALTKTGDLKGAEAALCRARTQAPGHADAAVNLADLYEAADRLEDAAGVLANYLRYHPADASVATRKARLLEALPKALHAAWQERSAPPVGAAPDRKEPQGGR
jgi:Flp pilus assembly protein TadD